MSSEPMTHVCGTCTLCCKLLAVKELGKPINKWCEFCTPGQGCNIYSARPNSCREFECGWLLSNLPMEFRPDHLHLVITGEDNKIGAAVVHQDPKYPDALNSKNGRKLIDMFARNQKSVIVVTGDKRKIISHSVRDSERVQQILREYEDGKE